MLPIIKINTVFGLVFNSAAVVAAGMGWRTPILASIVHNIGGVLLVVVASANLAIFPEPE